MSRTVSVFYLLCYAVQAHSEPWQFANLVTDEDPVKYFADMKRSNSERPYHYEMVLVSFQEISEEQYRMMEDFNE